MRPGKHPRPGGRGFEPVLLPVAPDGLVDLDLLRRGGRRPHPAGQRHGGEQRDRRGAGFGRDRRHRQGGGRAVPYRCGAGLRRDPAGCGGDPRPTCCRSPATRSTGRRASARCTSAAGRGCGWCRCSRAAGRSAASAPAPCRRRWCGARRGGRLAAIEGLLDAGRIAGQRDLFLARLETEVPGIRVNGSRTARVPGNLT